MNNLGSGESKLETAISYILIIGVVLSMVLLVIGIALFYHFSGKLSILLEDKAMFLQGQNFFGFLYGLFNLANAHNLALLFMTMGIATLILTPYIRVIASAAYFAFQKDFKYLFITVFVLVVLTLSLALH